MLFNPFSFRNIFYGVVLGMLVMVIWLFHGEIWAYLQTQAPEMKAILRTAVDEGRNISAAPEPEASPGTAEPPRPATIVKPQEAESPVPVIEVLEQGSSVATEEAPEEAPAVSHEEETVTLYPFRSFDSAATARRFVDSIRKSAGVELQVERQSHRYVVLIPALDEAGKERKAALIREQAGVKP